MKKKKSTWNSTSRGKKLLKMKTKISLFRHIEKLHGLIPGRSAPQEMLKEIPQTEEK